MEGLNVIHNGEFGVFGISQTLYSANDGSPVITSYDLIAPTVRVFFYEGSKQEYTLIAQNVCGKTNYLES
ncbi:hypothetical protein [Paenibacillus donghaensis]|uniref:hypothetical protein n=1 Tax=Paenibacillus donghaensis TaxID=414771 RepID=UPI0012FE5DE9|nr:hypothetical protein [Paenibacillus donghaensis]